MNKVKETFEAAKDKAEKEGKLARFFGTFIKELKEGKNVFRAFVEALKRSVNKDLKTLKKDVEQKKEGHKEKPEESKPEAEEKTEAPAAEDPKIKIPKVNLDKFRKGEVFASIKDTFENTEVESKLVPLKTHIGKNMKGAPGWTKKSTDDWDYEKAGNTDENIKKGIYNIEGAQPPSGYTRNISALNKIPAAIKPKLTKIAVALLKDPRMPLFTGIAMNVDGVQVMMIKEIHMHARGTASEYLCQPHTGVSYIVKSSQANV